MASTLRSFFSFTVGLFLIAIGLSTMVADLSPLRLAQTAPIAAVAAGLVLVAALIGAPRPSDDG